MKTHLLGLSALLVLAACGSSGSGDPPRPTGSAAAATGSGKKGDAPVSIPQNPEDNYVAAAAKIGCLGLSAADAAGLARDRAVVLKDHGYTEDAWKAASKQLGASRGDDVVKAMETRCPE